MPSRRSRSDALLCYGTPSFPTDLPFPSTDASVGDDTTTSIDLESESPSGSPDLNGNGSSISWLSQDELRSMWRARGGHAPPKWKELIPIIVEYYKQLEMLPGRKKENFTREDRMLLRGEADALIEVMMLNPTTRAWFDDQKVKGIKAIFLHGKPDGIETFRKLVFDSVYRRNPDEETPDRTEDFDKFLEAGVADRMTTTMAKKTADRTGASCVVS